MGEADQGRGDHHEVTGRWVGMMSRQFFNGKEET